MKAGGGARERGQGLMGNIWMFDGRTNGMGAGGNVEDWERLRKGGRGHAKLQMFDCRSKARTQMGGAGGI